MKAETVKPSAPKVSMSGLGMSFDSILNGNKGKKTETVV